MNWEATIWLVLTVILLIVEAVCPYHLVCIWFAVGSAVAMITALFGVPVWVQGLVFLVVSCGLLAAMMPWVKKVLNPKIEKTNVDSVIGSRGYVTESIDNLRSAGQVKLGGMVWTARSRDGQTIEEGRLVQVERIEGVKVFVYPVQEEE